MGGIADYVAQIADALARAGDEVTVWTKGTGGASDVGASLVQVETLPRGFDAEARRRIQAWLTQFPDAVVVLQYVPLGFGGLSFSFARWFTRLPNPRWIMFHEVAYPFIAGQPIRRDVLALVTRMQAHVLMRAAERTFVSTPAWEDMLRTPQHAGQRPVWLPIGSNVPVALKDPPRALTRAELGLSAAGAVVGHFGSFGPLVADPLAETLELVLRRDPLTQVLLVGRGSHEFVRARIAPELRSRVKSLGETPAGRVSEALTATDLVLSPFPDGVTTRRTTVMAALATGCPVVTNAGCFTESCWRDEDCVELSGAAPCEMADHVCSLLLNPARRAHLARRAREVYAERIALEVSVRTLRLAREPPCE